MANVVTREHFVEAVAVVCGLSRPEAWRTAQTVVAALAARLAPSEARELAAALPEPFDVLVRNSATRRRERDLAVGRICSDLGCEVGEAVRRVRGVFAVIERVTSAAALEDALGELPDDSREELKAPA